MCVRVCVWISFRAYSHSFPFIRHSFCIALYCEMLSSKFEQHTENRLYLRREFLVIFFFFSRKSPSETAFATLLNGIQYAHMHVTKQTLNRIRDG